MAIRLSLVIGLAILVGLPVGISSQPVVAAPSTTDSLSDTVTMVGSDTVDVGKHATELVQCPSGMVALGGGIDNYNVLTMKVTSSAPVFGTGPNDRLLNQPDGANPAPTGWRASVRSDDTRTLPFKVAAICAPLSGVSAVVGSDTADAGQHATVQVQCPAGTVAVGGGLDPYNVLNMKVTSSAPMFGKGPNDRLLKQPDGANPAPTGWRASVRNDDTRNLTFKVAAICAPLSDVSAVVGSDTAPAGGYRSEQVECPEGSVAVGGGIDVYNVLNMKVTATYPVFGPGTDRLLDQPDGINPAPTGWAALARNDDTRDLEFKVAAICGQPGHRIFLPLVMNEFEP